jgi:uncharacterized damage-inducible protein DinB
MIESTTAARLQAAFDFERDRVRDALARVPGDRLDWRPHPRARSLGELVVHVARIPGWIDGLLDAASYDLSAGSAGEPPVPAATEEILARFDANCARARQAIAARSDDELTASWRLERSGELVRALTRGEAVRVYLLDHWIHHRGQLVVYLRLLDVPVPALYGDSADEPA